MDKELKDIIDKMIAAGEPESAIATVIQGWDDLKKKEETKVSETSPEDTESDSQLEDTSLESSEDISQPENVEEELPPKSDEVVSPLDATWDEPTALLYDWFKQEEAVTTDQAKAIDTKLNKQKSGDRGFIETATAMMDGMLQLGVAVPLFQFDNKKDLTDAREDKNRIDFLSKLPDEKRLELAQYTDRKADSLSVATKNIAAENIIIEEKSKQLVFDLKSIEKVAKQLIDQGAEPSKEDKQKYKELYEELITAEKKYNTNVDLIESNNEDLGTFAEELNLLKRHYVGLDYYKDVARLTGAGLMSGMAEVLMSTPDIGFTGMKNLGLPMAEELSQANAQIVKGAEEFNANFRKEISRQQEYIKPPLSVSDIESESDFGVWLAEQVATQLPVLTVLAVGGSGIGLTSLSASAGGQKLGELKDKGGTNKEAMYLASAGTAALEYLTEKVSLGILSKGTRVMKAGAKPKMKVGFGERLSKSWLGSGGEEGSAEFVNQLGQNLFDILLLGDKDVHLFDGTIDALASGGAMGIGMHGAPSVMGMGAKTFMERDNSIKISTNMKRINSLLEEIETKKETLSPETSKLLTNKVNSLLKENEKEFVNTFEFVSRLDEESIKELINVDKKSAEIVERVKEVRESEMDDDIKKDLLLDFKEKAEKLKEKKSEILEKAKSLPKKEVVNEEVQEEVTEEAPIEDKELKKLEEERDSEIAKLEKPQVKLSLVQTKDIVNSKDPLGNKQVHDEIKDRYKKIKSFIECL